MARVQMLLASSGESAVGSSGESAVSRRACCR